MSSFDSFFGAPPVAEVAPPVVTAPAAGGVGWSLPIDHLSASSFGTWSRCPEQWRRRYLKGEKERPGGAQVIGTGFHFAQEHNFKQKIETHEDLPVTEIVEAFHHGLDVEIEKTGGVGEIVWGNEKPDTQRAQGATLTQIYREAVSPAMQPEAIELNFELTESGIAVPIHGRIDFDGAREHGVPWDNDYVRHETVVDYKTSSKSMSTLKEDWVIQAFLYQRVKQKRVEYHVAVKTKAPKIITPIDVPGVGIDVDLDKQELVLRNLRRFVRQMELYYERFGPDEVWPSGAPYYSWACGYCGFEPTCPLRQS